MLDGRVAPAHFATAHNRSSIIATHRAHNALVQVGIARAAAARVQPINSITSVFLPRLSRLKPPTRRQRWTMVVMDICVPLCRI